LTIRFSGYSGGVHHLHQKLKNESKDHQQTAPVKKKMKSGSLETA
jgi:hypothetical protein